MRVRNENLVEPTKKLLGIKMSIGLNKFLSKFKSKSESNVGTTDKSKLYKEQFRLCKEYVDKHGKSSVVGEIAKLTEESMKNKKPRGSKKKKRSKTKK